MSDEKPGALPPNPIPPQNRPEPLDDARRIEVLRRFRRNCAGLGYQALRSAVLTYLTESKR